MTLRAVDGVVVVALGLLLAAGCSPGRDTGFTPQESSAGSLEISVTRDSRSYSFRSDPEVEFLRRTGQGGLRLRPHIQTVVYSDGRFVQTHSDRQGNTLEVYETKLTREEMHELLRLIVESGLADHNHVKAKIATIRDPTKGRGAKGCEDCTTVSLTIRLAESNCPGRQPSAPITVTVTSTGGLASRFYPEVSEYVAVDNLSRTLSEYRKRSRVTRSQ